MAFIINVALIAVLALPLILFGGRILAKWIGPTFSQASPLILTTIVCSFALLGMNVTAHYALLAAGQVRVVTYLNLFAGLVMLLCMAMLIPRYGLQGAAWARLVYGPLTCLAYLYLYKIVWRSAPHNVSSRPRAYKVAVTGTD